MYVKVLINIFINTFEFNDNLKQGKSVLKNLIHLKTFVIKKPKANLYSSVSENTAHL